VDIMTGDPNPEDSRTLDATWAELEQIAIDRYRHTGKICAVTAITGTDRARVVDLGIEVGPDGEPRACEYRDHGTVPLMHPSPSVAERCPESGEADDIDDAA
jgi:hypothetical protein